jgi:hypothetical protein
MCSSRARSDGGILHLGRSKNILTEVAAQIFGRTEIHWPANNRFDLELHTRQSKEPGRILRLKFDQNVDVALGPKLVRQHRSEERKTANVMPPAELGDEFTIELDVRRHRERLYRPSQTLGTV